MENGGTIVQEATNPAIGEINPRTISIKHDPEGRKQILESAIKSKDIAEKGKKIQQIAELTSSSAEQERQKVIQLALRTETLLVKVKSRLGLGDKEVTGLQTEIDAFRSDRDKLRADSSLVEADLEALKQGRTEIPKPSELLKAYYEKMLTLPLSNEQKRDLLKPEVLASLSTEEYIALWRRLNPHFLTHVTRQGFRDHSGMPTHRSGLQEFHNGFLNIMEDAKLLRPPLAITYLKDRDESTVKEALNWSALQAKNETEAMEIFGKMVNEGLAAAPKYPDMTAVHFCGQKVGNAFYGAENNNEIFFVFPSDVIASQNDFAFNWRGGNFTEPSGAFEPAWNDIFVWSHAENSSISVDMGFAFLPENTPVDSKTGSKYATEVKTIDGQEKRVMIEDVSLINRFTEWGSNLSDQSPTVVAYKRFNTEGTTQDRRQYLRDDCESVIRQELEKLGFGADVSWSLAGNLFGQMYDRENLKSLLLGIVTDSSANWKRAENPIKAKEYWEKRFVEHPNLRPKHIVYYDGSPTQAVLKFQQRNNIGRADTSGEKGPYLDFDDHHVVDVENDPRANVGYDELVRTATRIIHDHYNPKNT